MGVTGHVKSLGNCRKHPVSAICSVVNNIISGPCIWCLDSGFEPLGKIKLPLIELKGLFSEISGIPLFLWTIGRSKEISPNNKENFCWEKKMTPDIPSSPMELWRTTDHYRFARVRFVLCPGRAGSREFLIFSFLSSGRSQGALHGNQLEGTLHGPGSCVHGTWTEEGWGLRGWLALIFWTIYRPSSFQVQRGNQGTGNGIWICAMCYGEPGNLSREVLVDRELICYPFIYLAALGLSCGMQNLSLQHSESPLCLMHSRVQGLSSCGPRLSCPTACGIFVPWPEIEPASPTLQSRFLTSGPPGKSLDLLS